MSDAGDEFEAMAFKTETKNATAQVEGRENCDLPR
jgi:hypothetical protein